MLDQKLKQRENFMAQLEAAETRLISRAISSHCKGGIRGGTQDKREVVRLPPSCFAWVPRIIPVGEKVDLIYHFRRQISRLNIEIAGDQDSAHQNTCLHSAFIQFERSIDAHIVSQSVAHITYT